MVQEKEVEGIAKLADITIANEKLAGFTSQFNKILEYFDTLDSVPADETMDDDLYNVLREDEIEDCLPQDIALKNAGDTEDGYIKSPKVM